MLHEPHQLLELHGLGPHRWQRTGKERSRFGPLTPGGPGAGQGDGIEAPGLRTGQPADHEVAGVEGLEGMVDDDPPAGRHVAGRVVGKADGAVDDIEQLTDRDGRGALGVGPLVASAVGDDQVALGGQQRVEQQLAVLAAGIAVTDPGVGGDEVVVVDVDLAGEHAVVEAEEADDPVGDRPHGHQRAHGEVPGAEVGPGRAAPQAVGQQRADLRETELRPVAVGGAGPAGFCFARHVVEQMPEFRRLPRVGGAGGGQHGGRVGQGGGPAADRLRAG